MKRIATPSRIHTISLALTISALFASFASAQVPMMINYQGRLLSGTNLYNGPANLTFRLFNVPTGGSALFESTNFATVVDGLYATAIGQFVTLGSLDSALTNAQVWLEVVVNGTTLTPRERVLAVPYARAVHGLRVTAGNGIILNPVAGTNTIDPTALHSTIGGGRENSIQTSAEYATIGGGRGNSIEADAWFATIGGGEWNSIQTYADYATIGGGYENAIQTNAFSATIGGGEWNSIQPYAEFATIGGGDRNTIQTNASYSTIGGGRENTIQTYAPVATIGGGYRNSIQPYADNATIGGGFQNSIQPDAYAATIGGGGQNTIQTNAIYATIGGGAANTIQTSAWYSTIGGGRLNTIQTNALHATIGGGERNAIQNNGQFATIPGGELNSATNYAFAAGRRAKANHTGSFVWGDSINADVASSASNQVTFRASGGFRIFSNPGMSTGVQVAANSGAWTSISDVNAKEGFEPVNPAEVLEKVVLLPITTWRYKGQSEEIRHMGPTAQDFYAAFGLGDLPGTGITSIDADGVALAAIQALAQRSEALAQQNEALARENAELRAELERQREEFNKRLQALETR